MFMYRPLSIPTLLQCKYLINRYYFSVDKNICTYVKFGLAKQTTEKYFMNHQRFKIAHNTGQEAAMLAELF